jgi:NADH:ubiquinone oxidoreductase subunit E
MNTVREILSKYPNDRQQILNVLHEIQDAEPRNYITENAMQAVAEYFNTTKGSVYGVVTYYSMLSTKPRGKNLIRICKSPVCHIQNSISLAHELKELLEIDEVGESSPDNEFTLEYTECLGKCEHAPGMLINEDFYGHLDMPKIREIIKSYRNKNHHYDK